MRLHDLCQFFIHLIPAITGLNLSGNTLYMKQNHKRLQSTSSTLKEQIRERNKFLLFVLQIDKLTYGLKNVILLHATNSLEENLPFHYHDEEKLHGKERLRKLFTNDWIITHVYKFKTFILLGVWRKNSSPKTHFNIYKNFHFT